MERDIRLRVWAEFVEPQEMREKRVVELLKKYGVVLGISLPYGKLDDEYARMLELYEKEGLEVALWLLLPRCEGYWPSERNVDKFYNYLQEVFLWAKEKGVSIPWIAVDLEMPLNQFDELKSARSFLGKIYKGYKILKSNKNPSRFKEAEEKYKEVLNLIHQHNAKAITAAIPIIMEDIIGGNNLIQDLLETPITGVKWDCVSLMIYNSMYIGAGGGLLRKKDLEYLLFKYASEAVDFFKERAGISLGVTYIGVLGDESYYEKPEDIAGDVSATLSAGIKDIAIYNLEGILRAKEPEEWFKIVLESKPQEPSPTTRIKMARYALRTFPKIIF